MQHKAPMLGQPLPHPFMPVGAVVVEDQMQGNVAWEFGVQPPQKFQELLMAVPWIALTDDSSFCHLQCGKQRRRAVAFIIMGESAAASWLHGQAGLGAIPWFAAPHAELFRDEGRVLFWGCNIAKGPMGLLFLELAGRLLLLGHPGKVMASDSLNFKFNSLPIEPIMAPFGAQQVIYFDRDGKVLVRQSVSNG